MYHCPDGDCPLDCEECDVCPECGTSPFTNTSGCKTCEECFAWHYDNYILANPFEFPWGRLDILND